jgi:hypothetical protein
MKNITLKIIGPKFTALIQYNIFVYLDTSLYCVGILKRPLLLQLNIDNNI